MFRHLNYALLSIFLCTAVAFGQVAKNDSGTNINSNASAETLSLTSYTVDSGSNLCLLAAIVIDGNPSSTSATWDVGGTDQAMTSRAVASISGAYVEWFVLPNPATGNLVLTVSWSGAGTAMLVAITFSGADQSTCVQVGDEQTQADSGTGITLSIPTTSDGATVAAIRGANVITRLNSTDLGEAFTYLGSSYNIGGSGTNPHTWTSVGGPGNQAAAGVHIIAAGGGGGGSKRMTLMGVGP